MKVVILCGGKGTRIRDVSELLPKPMVPIGEIPILEHIMNIYYKYGHKEFILCLGYKGWVIKEYFLNYLLRRNSFKLNLKNHKDIKIYSERDIPDWEIIFVETGEEAMTGCRIKRIQKFVGNETFMLTYGDGLANINLDNLYKFHKGHKKFVTITAVRPVSRFGELVMNRNKVIDFIEKPQTSQGLINGGFFIF